MTNDRFTLPLAVLAFSAVSIATAQVSSSLSRTQILTATLPIPLPDGVEKPLPPDMLRNRSPWTLSVAGDWRFRLTHGRMVEGHFALSDTESSGLKASSVQSDHSPADAFDGNPETRWCASGGDFPQYLQAKIDATPRTVTAVDIAWERSETHYTCRIEGSNDGTHWRTLLDRSAAPGIGDGLQTLPQSGEPVRFVRVLVLGASTGSWASIRELKVHYLKDGQDVVWHPAPPNLAVPPHADDFVATGFDDKGWSHLAVPSNWEMAGYSIPTYDSVDDTVGLYRRWVEVPADWKGRDIIWRFDGALDGAEVFVNGQKAGYHESGYTAFDVDLTGLIKPGHRNLLAVRVCKSTPSVDCETGDYQCMGGIDRDTRLIAVPTTHISDVTVRTPLSSDYRDATLQVKASIAGRPGEVVRVTGFVSDAATKRRLPVTLSDKTVIGKDGLASVELSSLVKGPKLWSAEKPSLYYLTLALQGDDKTVERVEQRFGFRQVEIKKNIVLWNGKPIKCTGICRHDFWPNKGFALTDTEWRKDLTLMKETNINAIRTSHYNHAARFLELCEERGFYILDEVPFCWVNDKVKDPKFAPPLLQRAAETVARDKNRPCVLAWSLGNENPVGVDTQRVHDLVKYLDPTRPSFASGAGPDSVKGQELFDTHYPSPGSIRGYVERNSGVAPEVITEHPHTFYSRETQTYDPGASDTWSEGLIATWSLMWRSPTILGSFIWEWQSQGIADKFPDHTTDFYYGLDHMRQENNKGIMDAYRHPKAEQWIVKMVYSPIQLPSKSVRIQDGASIVRFTNHYSFTDLKELKVRWTALKDKSVLAHGDVRVACAAGESVDAKLATPQGITSLKLEIDRNDGSCVTLANLAVPGSSTSQAPACLADRSSLSVNDGSETLEVGSAGQKLVFDKRTGMIRSWEAGGHNKLRDGGPYLNLGEAKTAQGDHFYRAAQPPITQDATVTAKSEADGSVVVTAQSQVLRAIGSSETLGKLTVDYTIRPSAEIAVRWRLDWTAPDINLWEIGLCMPVPAGMDHQSWYRDTYFTAYPEGHIGAPSGTCGPKDVVFRSSKRFLHFLSLTDGSGTGLALIATDAPLIGRARAEQKGITLYASSEMAAAGPDDLSQSWFHDHDIHATHSKPLSGEFILRAIGGS